MFERYTENARRTIFFARYEASQFGSPYIETEHLLLGLLRQDKALLDRLLRSHAAMESIRKQIEGHRAPGAKVSTSVDLPLSHEAKRVLAYAAEEAQRLDHEHIGTEHLLLALLREKACFAAQLLGERDLTLASVREQVQQSESPRAEGGSDFFARLDQWLTEREAPGGTSAVNQRRVANRTIHICVYADDPPNDHEEGENLAPEEKALEIQKRIDFIVGQMERAIANHDFDKARFYSEEERKERENLRSLRQEFNLEEPPPRIPILCIDIIHDQRFSEVHERCEDYIAEGVTAVWLLDPKFKRAYTVTKTDGLREFKGEILQTANPPLEMDLKRIFD
ncbi:MAG TPA: Clp protease N-terminal domain-containing protein [Bryobacteraceae bacterium]|nr:Clp protease N-terminal domain-containing protein [Bryobacteraceae bacterium]